MHILAYIDPGLGALIWQSMIGVLVGMLFYLRKTRKWIGGLMGRAFRTKKEPGTEAPILAIDKKKLEADRLQM